MKYILKNARCLPFPNVNLTNVPKFYAVFDTYNKYDWSAVVLYERKLLYDLYL